MRRCVVGKRDGGVVERGENCSFYPSFITTSFHIHPDRQAKEDKVGYTLKVAVVDGFFSPGLPRILCTGDMPHCSRRRAIRRQPRLRSSKHGELENNGPVAVRITASDGLA